MSDIDEVDLPVLMSIVKDKLENPDRAWFLEVKLNARECERLVKVWISQNEDDLQSMIMVAEDKAKKQGALEELVKQVKDLEIVKKLLNKDIDCVGNLNIVKNRNKLWFLTGEINIIGNQIEKLNNRIKDLKKVGV